MKRLVFFSILAFVLLTGAHAADAMAPELEAVWRQRADLQAAFDATGAATEGTAAGFLIDMADWARQYGWQSYVELQSYAPLVLPPRHDGRGAPDVRAAAWIVVDKNSGAVLGAQHAEALWPMASITKLMTADIVSRQAPDLDAWHNVYDSDDPGGAKLTVAHGSYFRLRDLLYATLVGSANNTANAITRILGGTREEFVAYMNTTARAMGLSRTRFADPSGIDPANVSTARELAYMAERIFSQNEAVRTMAQTYRRVMADAAGNTKSVMTTNWMLYRPEYDDVWVTAGKTGFLHESDWNVVEQLRPSRFDGQRELVVVVLGSPTRAESFQNVERLSRWAWDHFSW